MAGELNVAVPGGGKPRRTRRGVMLPPAAGENGFRRAPGTGVDLAAVAHALHADVIPALVRRHQARSNGRANGHRALPWVPTTASDVTELARLVVGADDGMAETFVERLRQGGVPSEVLCRDVLEPAARELGDLWCSDDLDFTQVTIGVWRLQRLARGFDAGSAAVAGPLAQRRVLLAPMPGEQHSFGLYTVGASFRRAGWMVVSDVPLAPAALAQLVREEWFAVVGFSVGSERQLDAVRAIVRAVRAASRNPAVGILVGGPVLRQRPALVHEVGADLTARDGPEAVRQATRFLDTGVRT